MAFHCLSRLTFGSACFRISGAAGGSAVHPATSTVNKTATPLVIRADAGIQTRRLGWLDPSLRWDDGAEVGCARCAVRLCISVQLQDQPVELRADADDHFADDVDRRAAV